MNFLEKDLEEIIFTSSIDKLISKGLPIVGRLKRQLRIGNYGIADLISFERSYEISFNDIGNDMMLFKPQFKPKLIITVYELKKENISLSAFIQATRYVKGIQRYLKLNKFNHSLEFKIILIGKSIPLGSDLIYLPDVFSNVSFYTYFMDIDGLKFKHHSNYCLKNENLKL